MNNDVQLYRETMDGMLFEVGQAARSMSALSDLVVHYMEGKTKDLKFDETIGDTMWVVEQLTSHQRYMLERIEIRLKHVTAVEVPESHSGESFSVSESIQKFNEIERYAPV